MKSIQIVLAFFFILIGNEGFSQNSCDVMVTSLKVNDGIIITGRTSSGASIVTKIDTQGNELWRINEGGTHFYANGIKLFSDGYVYILMQLASSQSTGNNTKLVKINPANGQVAWRSTIIGSDDDIAPDFLEYDSNRIFFCTGIKDNNGGTAAGFKTFIIQKSNGFSQLNSTSDRYCSSLKIAKDSKGNIIYATNNLYNTNTDLMITKVNGFNMKNTLWQKKYNNTVTGATLPNVNKLFLDDLDNIYALSGGNTIDMFKIDSSTGNELWSINNIAYERYISDYKFKHNSLFLSFLHMYVGSTYTSFEIVKINLGNASVAWTSNSQHMTFTGAPIPGGVTGTNEGVFSFDVDCNGDVFATGYYGSANYSPGAWGIMKINGATGVKINDLTITNNPSTINTLSYGNNAFVFDSYVVFLGNLQYSTTKTSRTFVKTNFQLSSNYYKKYLCFIDSDGDSIQDFDEDVNGNGFIENDDTDNDGIPNYLDNDDDNDGVLTINEDHNNNHNPLDDFSDPTHPNLPDYLNNAIALGIDELFENDIKIYPNPTNGIINIAYSQNIAIEKIELFSINGVKLIEKNEGIDTMDISNLSSGIYFLKIKSDYGVYTKKVIKE
ncbi:T9SS type A sorting domain-containing protein [Flavobacterium pedocola]